MSGSTSERDAVLREARLRTLRVLLISANTEKLPDPVFPIGAAYMAAADRAGHEVETLDLCFLDRAEPAVEEKLRTFAPDVVGISLRNLDSTSYPHPARDGHGRHRAP